MPIKTPVDCAVSAFGSVEKMAVATGIPPSTIYRWRYPRGQGGSDGRIPSGRQALVLRAAKEAGVSLKAGDLVMPDEPAAGAEAVAS